MDIARFDGTIQVTFKIKGNIRPSTYNNQDEFEDWVQLMVEDNEAEWLSVEIINHELITLD